MEMSKYFGALYIVIQGFLGSVSPQIIKEEQPRPCPNGFAFYPNNGGTCVEILSFRRGPPECSYPGGFDYELIDDIAEYMQSSEIKLNDSSIWYPAVRNTYSKTEFIEHLHKTINFNDVRASMKHRYRKLSDGNCVAYDSKNRELLLNVPCSENYDSICVHKSMYQVTINIALKDNNQNVYILRNWTKMNCTYSIFEAKTCFVISRNKLYTEEYNLKESQPQNKYHRWIVNRLKEDEYCPDCYVYEHAFHYGRSQNRHGSIRLEHDPFKWSLLHLYLNFFPYEISDSSLLCLQRFENGTINKMQMKRSIKGGVMIYEVFRETFIGQYWCHAYLPNFYLLTSNVLTLKADPDKHDYQFIIEVHNEYYLSVMYRKDPTYSEEAKYLATALNYFNFNAVNWSTETKNQEIENLFLDEGITDIHLIKLDHRLQRYKEMYELAVLWCKVNLRSNGTLEETVEYRNYLQNKFKNSLRTGATYVISFGLYCESTNELPTTEIEQVAIVNLQEEDEASGSGNNNNELEEGEGEEPLSDISGEYDLEEEKEASGSENNNNQKGTLTYCRKCNRDYIMGAIWENQNQICKYQRITDSASPTFLNDTLEATRFPQNISAKDLKEISKFMKKQSSLYVVHNMIDKMLIISNLMNIPTETLKTAQNENTTDEILDNLDNNLLSASNVGKGPIITSNIIAQVENFNQNSYSYISLMESSTEFSTTSAHTELIFSNTATNTAKAKLSLYIPPKVIEYGKNMHSRNRTPFLAAATIFYKDSLFVEEESESKVHGKIVSVLLSGLSDLPEPIQVSFRTTTDQNLVCGYWKYGTGIKGRWVAESDPKITENGNLLTCSYTHLTHFGMLVDDRIENKTHFKLLSIITAIGCTLSTISLLAIVATAIKFKSWRKDTGHKILIQFSALILTKYLLFYVADSNLLAKDYSSKGASKYIFCNIISALLHYVILSEFCWMLVLAVLQYRRFVKILNAEYPHTLLISSLFSCLFPVIPAVTVVVINAFYKTEQNSQICFIGGLQFYLALILPIAIIIVVNVVLLCRIIWSVNASQKQGISRHNTKQNLTKTIVKLGTFLFFLLGLTWIFALTIVLGGGIVFSYLFCITGPLQGLVIFLFFIVWNEKTKSMWYSCVFNLTQFTNNLRICCFRQGTYRVYEPTSTTETTFSVQEGNSRFYQ